jgi:hypothetical protein
LIAFFLLGIVPFPGLSGNLYGGHSTGGNRIFYHLL